MQKKKKSTLTKKRGRPPQKAVTPHQPRRPIKDFPESEALQTHENNGLALHIAPFIIIIFAVYIFVAFVVHSDVGAGNVGGFGIAVRNVFFGLFAGVSYLIPFILIGFAICLKKDVESGFFTYRVIFSLLCFMFYSAFLHLVTPDPTGFNAAILFDEGIRLHGGGVIGGFIATAFRSVVGSFGAGLFIISLSLIFSVYLFGITPVALVKFFIQLIQNYKNNKENYYKREIVVKKKDPTHMFRNKTSRYTITTRVDPQQKPEPQKKQQKINPDVSIENKELKESGRYPNMGENPYSDTLKGEEQKKSRPDFTVFPDKNLFEEAKKDEVNSVKTELDEHKKKKIEIKNGELLDEIFEDEVGDETDFDQEFATDENPDEPDEDDDSPVINLSNVESTPMKREDEPEVVDNKFLLPIEIKKVFPEDDEPHKAEYRLPSLSFLTKDTSVQNVDVSEELGATALKLVDTLASFGVKTKISNYSRGPAITRYEISPNAGVKVRSIVNLVDDISLNLATGGVRIEAPIPGKSAVGVEVPNKIVSTVHLRSLLEEPQFEQAVSKVTVVLGMDVAGNAIYSDISKMPHLLIAGATGMGKSVCINSIITSILYKAKPDEVKLILIDPKKVELNIYNGIPHLLVPVVSDPKKAAGSLAWAVGEMENRFILIEERGVRDLRTYNEVIKDDPTAEPLPQIVIIIDELADLMMTAPADVEQSICRLAQKARAAGMHLIIGTQRPSVDVITGLIKANIPSRIAFTVASQIDSRTIIDIGGAEKLIGRGDMLYLPVGSAKPMRVQGAYVSEKDVLSVTDFLKRQSDGTYDESIQSQIEMEAQRCNTKGAKMQNKDADATTEEELEKEPMLKPAIEIAVETGRISTSLLQTRLSLGYARAARIIEKMEKMNIIGPFEGSKPRKVLITKQEFIEMTMHNEI